MSFRRFWATINDSKIIRYLGRWKIFRGILISICFFSINISSVVAQPFMCGINWSTPVQISSDSILSLSPRFAFNQSTVHALWYGIDTLGTASNDGIQYARSTDGGRTFSIHSTLVSPDTAFSPGLLATSGNLVYVTFTGFIGNSFGTAFIRSFDNGMTWQPVAILSENTQPQLMRASDSVVLIHYLKQRGGYGMLRSGDYGQTWRVINSNMFPLNDIYWAAGQLHAVGGVSLVPHTEVGYYYSMNGGSIWIGPEIISPEDPISSLYPKISVNTEGTRFIVWTDTGTVVIRKSDGYDEEDNLLWETPLTVYDRGDAIFPDVVVTDGMAVVAWDIRRGDSTAIQLLQSVDAGKTFCANNMPIGEKAGEPFLEIRDNIVHMIWSGEVATGGEILYMQGALTPDTLPKAFSLKQNYPNPVSNITHIPYEIPRAGHATLIVYNLLGQKVATVVDRYLEQQRYIETFDTGRLPSGVYFYRLRTPYTEETKKMIVIR